MEFTSLHFDTRGRGCPTLPSPPTSSSATDEALARLGQDRAADIQLYLALTTRVGEAANELSQAQTRLAQAQARLALVSASLGLPAAASFSPPGQVAAANTSLTWTEQLHNEQGFLRQYGFLGSTWSSYLSS